MQRLEVSLEVSGSVYPSRRHLPLEQGWGLGTSRSSIVLLILGLIFLPFSSTRGLDASTALEFVRALRIATDNLGLTSIVSIYQASENLYRVSQMLNKTRDKY